MAEFDEVGRTIENFASEDATVVIGTVLDPDMQDEVKVTVVATGLNRAVVRQPIRTGERADFSDARFNDARRPQVELVRTQVKRDGTTGLPIDDGFQGPPSFAGSLRGGRAEPTTAPAVADFGADSSYLDIPAFLRRQAD
jgi:cell division protein FtsZ